MMACLSRAGLSNPLDFLKNAGANRREKMQRKTASQGQNTDENSDQTTTHFGFQTVGVSDKQPLVDGVFARVARRYDLMNDVMSGGLHRAWKDHMVAKLRVPKTRPFHVLDVAGGTGDIAMRIVKDGGAQTRVTLSDINLDMLVEGEKRIMASPYVDQIDLQEADATNLPFADNSFDAYTIAFGLRNVPDIAKALREAHRVLKPGGQFLCLEFSHVDVPGVDKIYEAYSFRLIPELGARIAGDRDAYQYLVESIRQFPKPVALISMMEGAGLSRAMFERLTFGVVALHRGWKI